MKWIVGLSAAAWIGFAVAPVGAQSINGCWNYSDGTVFSTVCFTGAEGGTFNLEYAAEDPDQGLIKGSCNASVQVRAIEGNRVAFSVPYQEGACRQENIVFRVAERDYECDRQGATLVCGLTVYHDDGSVYSQAEGLRYSR